MKSVFQTTFRNLERVVATTPEVLVAYSGGKDSLAVLDLCCKVFPTVRAFFKYTVPGLEYCEKQMRWAKERYNVEVIQFPSIGVLESFRDAVWCDGIDGLDVPSGGYPLKVSFRYAQELAGIKTIATGMKDADGLKRRQFFANIRDGKDPMWNDVLHPIRDWRKKDVLDYLKVNNIPLPAAEKGAVTTGIGLDHDSLCWLHDDHPEDFKKLLKWFPYAEAAVKRRDFYGLT